MRHSSQRLARRHENKNLLFTDPSTSPRTELGRIFFGILYGLSIVGLHALLKSLGAPCDPQTFRPHEIWANS